MPMTAEQMEAAYCDPSTGSIKRRWLKRRLAGINPVGPTVLNPQPAAPTKAELVAAQKYDSEIRRAHRETVEAELAAIDRHGGQLRQQLGDGRSRSYLDQELRAELAELAVLRREIEADIEPITRDVDGKPADDRTRDYVRARSAEIRESLWANAAREAAAGDRRQARMKRHDALRARFLAEREMRLRPTPRGYF